jgi:hypothetical protein
VGWGERIRSKEDTRRIDFVKKLANFAVFSCFSPKNVPHGGNAPKGLLIQKHKSVGQPF